MRLCYVWQAQWANTCFKANGKDTCSSVFIVNFEDAATRMEWKWKERTVTTVPSRYEYFEWCLGAVDELFLWNSWPTKALSLISSLANCRRFSLSQTDTPWADFEHAQNLSLDYALVSKRGYQLLFKHVISR